jgi:hypothetical protein
MIMVHMMLSCRVSYIPRVPSKESEPNPKAERIFDVKILEEFRPSP